MIDEISGLSIFESFADFCWVPQQDATLYEVARSDGVSFTTGCWVMPTDQTCESDATGPAPGATLFYLVRALAPNTGSWGQFSWGAERLAVCE